MLISQCLPFFVKPQQCNIVSTIKHMAKKLKYTTIKIPPQYQKASTLVGYSGISHNKLLFSLNQQLQIRTHGSIFNNPLDQQRIQNVQQIL